MPTDQYIRGWNDGLSAAIDAMQDPDSTCRKLLMAQPCPHNCREVPGNHVIGLFKILELLEDHDCTERQIIEALMIEEL